MKIMIAGSRTNKDNTQLLIAMQLLEARGIQATEILHGGAHGTDTHASEYARKNKLKETIIKPDYEKHYHKVAPLIRNTELVKKSEIVIAIYAPGQWQKGGTADAARKAKAAEKTTLEICADRAPLWTTPPLRLW